MGGCGLRIAACAFSIDPWQATTCWVRGSGQTRINGQRSAVPGPAMVLECIRTLTHARQLRLESIANSLPCCWSVQAAGVRRVARQRSALLLLGSGGSQSVQECLNERRSTRWTA